MANSIPLLHVWDNQKIAARKGLFTIGDGVTIPRGWEPEPNKYEPKALPTPFAIAEATRLVLARVDEAATHPLLQRFRWLLIGVAAGVLDVEPHDMNAREFDTLGRALLHVDPNARYFSRVIWRERGLVFGASYRSCLLWTHARRQDADWDALSRAFQQCQAQALVLLADWRETLRQGGRWNPELSHWQRGVDHVIGAVQPSPGLAELRSNARLVGPIMVELPTADAVPTLKLEPLYLPSYAEGFADEFIKLCNFQPALGHELVEFRDAQGRSVGSISLPAGGADVDPIALGMGTIRVSDGTKTPLAQQKLWARDLVQLLEPLALALARSGRPITGAAVSRLPVLYPDPIRVLVQRGYWPGAVDGGGAQQDRLTGRAELMLAAAGAGLPNAADAEAAGGVVGPLEPSTSGARVILVDSLRGVEVLDLRALGSVLYRVFVGDAHVSAELGTVQDAESLERLLLHTADHPLEPHADVYRSVESVPPRGVTQRLATLQRFVAAYSVPGGQRMLLRAARSFADWAAGMQVLPIGRTPVEFVQLRLPTGLELRLARDPLTPAGL